jgi:hypothetical protein
VSLTRVWTPTGNHSGGGKKRLIVLHSTEGFTGPMGAEDCAIYFQSDCGASSQVCIDNNRGKVWECVSRGNASWTQCNYNSVAVSAEQCGYASWSRDYWLTNREAELRNAADWIAEEAAQLGIPIRALSASEAQGGAAGVTYHSHLGSTGCGHSDPGDGYPLDQVLEWATGGGGAAPAPGQQEDDDMLVMIPSGKALDSNHDIGVAFTGQGTYNHIELCADVGRVGGVTCQVRVALHFADEGWGGVKTVQLKPGDSKVAIGFGNTVDGCAFRREDNHPVTLYAAISKY